MNQEIIQRLERIEAMLIKIIGVEPRIPAGISNHAAKLISLAKVDRAAAIIEAKRLSRESSRRHQHV